MEKNTAWAIGLSTLVLVGFMVVQTIFFPAPKAAPAAAPAAEKTAATPQSDASKTNTASNSPKEDATLLVSSATAENAEKNSVASQPAEEPVQTYVIKTNKIKVTFTNKGGDVIGYELTDHPDTDRSYKTADGKKAYYGVEMADNISDTNRAFSLSFGGADDSIINDTFTAHQIDDYTIGFAKNFTQKNADGTESTFTLVKTYSFKPDEYVFKLDVLVDGGDNFKGLNFDDASYTLRTSPQIGPHFNQKQNRYELRQFMSYNGEKKKTTTVGSNQKKTFDKEWKWTGIAGKYFCILVDPANISNMKNVTYSTSMEVANYANAQVRVPRKALGAGQTTDSYYIYVGPRNEKELVKYNVAEKNAWGLSGTHFNEALQSSGILSWLETALKFIMELIYKVIPNWGISIIILTALLKFAMFPLTKKTSLSTLKMQALQPKMTEIQTKYKDNPQKLQEATAKLYKESGYNPMTGCLPMLFQFIVLFAMYNLFNNYFEFRGAMFIPGWIPDLSTGDHVYTLGFNIPFLGSEIRILPVIYVISQLLFGKITQNGGTATGTSATQMKIMMYGMPIIFFFIFYNAPAGLLLYWTVSNIIQLGQQLVINKIMKDKMAESASAPVAKKGSKK